MTLTELRMKFAQLQEDLQEALDRDSDISIFSVYGRCHLLLLAYCLEHHIKIGNYDLGRLSAECRADGANQVTAYRRLERFFGDVAEDIHEGRLDDSKEFPELVKVYTGEVVTGIRLCY